jgi:hypothetical protein
MPPRNDQVEGRAPEDRRCWLVRSRHLRCIQRDGAARDMQAIRAYGPATNDAGVAAFEAHGREDRHLFRFIVAPEDAERLGSEQDKWCMGKRYPPESA